MIPSAWVRSSFPLRKARCENSPGVACVAPHSRKRERTSRVTRVPPWPENSTVSSPVNEFGARKMVMRPSSMVKPDESRILQRRERRGMDEAAMPLDAVSAMLMASGPEMRMTEMAPVPVGEAIAAIVELDFGIMMGFQMLFAGSGDV
jgi:hypothetical protein